MRILCNRYHSFIIQKNLTPKTAVSGTRFEFSRGTTLNLPICRHISLFKYSRRRIYFSSVTGAPGTPSPDDLRFRSAAQSLFSDKRFLAPFQRSGALWKRTSLPTLLFIAFGITVYNIKKSAGGKPFSHRVFQNVYIIISAIHLAPLEDSC